MTRSSLFKTAFSLVLVTVLVAGMVHLSATPAEALSCQSSILGGRCTLSGIEWVPPCHYCCAYDCPWGVEYFNCEATPH